ncbi:hypothetical protein [Mucilaginibacter arboris]|uniref:Uncharacterized protein n=1 Tax=Mucilaginibacter arboris TaxID=2682090 RepID=A0A7K1T0Z0_9SPHI|nr:hypothetical protein [Mucilaginibacter arboris]MVN23252.1 hypothetical protein [Mucilaginibacter arboris]
MDSKAIDKKKLGRKEIIILTGLAFLIITLLLGFVSLYFHWKILFNIIRVFCFVVSFIALVYNLKQRLKTKA